MSEPTVVTTVYEVIGGVHGTLRIYSDGSRTFTPAETQITQVIQGPTE